MAVSAARPPQRRAIWRGVAAAVVALPPVAAGLFVVVVILAGPHSSLLPSAVQPAVLALGWLALPAIPGWIGWKVFRRALAKAAPPE